MRFIFVLLSLFFSYQSCFSDQLTNILPTFEAYVQKSLSEWQASGVSIAIVKDGQIVYEKGFGVREVGQPEPVDAYTVMPIASLSKNFLVTLIAQLVDEGDLDWDAPVKKYLPDFRLCDPDITNQFTVRDLLSHRSGLKGFSADSVWNLGYSATEILDFLAQLPFEKGFRQDYAYQNHLFGIASDLVEKVTGQSIASLFQARLFNPLALSHSSVGPIEQPKKGLWQTIKGWFQKKPKLNIALPHHVIGGKTTVMAISPQMYTFKGSSGINTCAHDLGLWMIFQLNDGQINDKDLVSKAQITQMRTPHVQATNLRPDDMQFPALRMSQIHYGMGWFLGNYGNEGTAKVPFISHMGGFGGVRSLMTLIPNQNLGIVIISNFGSMRVSMLPESLRNKFLDLYLNLGDKDWSKENVEKMQEIRTKNRQFKNDYRLQNPRPHHDLKVYVGQYKNPLYGTFEIQLDKQGLTLVYRDRRVPLTHWNGDEFEFKGHDLTPIYCDYDQGYIEFGVQGQKALLSAINLMFEGKSEIFERVKEGS